MSVPSPRGPVVLDMAAAAAAFLRPQGAPSPPFGTAGLSGALAALDRSYKGAHLSVMVELLAGPLVGAGVAGAPPGVGEVAAACRALR